MRCSEWMGKPSVFVTSKQINSLGKKKAETKIIHRKKTKPNSSFKGLFYNIKESQTGKDTVLDSICTAVREQRQNTSENLVQLEQIKFWQTQYFASKQLFGVTVLFLKYWITMEIIKENICLLKPFKDNHFYYSVHFILWKRIPRNFFLK